MRRLKLLTWHVHGNYLYYLAQVPHDIYVPVKAGRPEGYGGRGGSLPWPDNLIEVPADEVRSLDLDCVLYQSRRTWLVDQYEILSDEQRLLPRVFLEHDPPREHPTDTRHVVDDPGVVTVHVTHFNDLMWDCGRTPTRVVEHGVMVPDGVRWSGELERGAVVVNNIAKRGRRLGADVFESVRREVPLDLVGMGSELAGGLGEVDHAALPDFVARRRFLFNPIRYTSLGLAVCEAMMLGAPVVALATTELVSVVENGVSGFVSTDRAVLVDRMRELLADRALASRLSAGARRTARERFSIERFVRDWNGVLAEATATRPTPPPPRATRSQAPLGGYG